MAGTLKVKIQEEILLDNQDYGSKRILEIDSIASVVKRIVSVSTTESGLLGFGTSTATNLSLSYLAGLFDEDNVRYIRITNLDSSNHIILIFRSEGNAEFSVKVDAGHSFIYPGDNSGGVVDTMDASASALTVSFEDLVDITADADTAACSVEVFVASA